MRSELRMLKAKSWNWKKCYDKVLTDVYRSDIILIETKKGDQSMYTLFMCIVALVVMKAIFK